MDGRATILYKGGKEIYLVDYSGIRDLQVFKDVITETGIFRDRLLKTGKNNLLLLVDVTGTELNMEIYEKLRKHGILTKPLVHKEAIVGMEKFQFIVNTYNISTGMNFKMFDTREGAIEWLLSEQMAI